MKITLVMSIKNSFNVISTGEYTLELNKVHKLADLNWTEYQLRARKIYYKDIIYENNKVS